MGKLTDKLLRIFNPSAQGDMLPDRKAAKRNKNSLLIEEIEYAFRESVEEMSTDRSLMFHCAFAAYVPQSYYRDLHLSFGVITQELVERFNEIIAEKLKKNKDMRVKPIFDYWSFDIIPLGSGCSDTPDQENPDSIVTYDDLEENFVAVRSSLVPSELYDFSTTSASHEVKTNRSQPNSKRDQLSILNIGAIQGLKPNGRGFQYPIALESASPAEPAQPRAGAKCSIEVVDVEYTFSYGKGGGRHRKIEMNVPTFYIGGATAATTYQGAPMVSLSSESVMNPHIQIRLDSDGQFKIKAFGPAKVNRKNLTPNEWTLLSSYNSSIILNDIELTFNRK